jgi:hypothetical protein
MKDKLKRVVSLLVLLVSSTSLYAVGPPNPGRRPPPPPKLPIDDYIGIVVILSILYGFYVISNKLKTKTPR